jgi:hypothetical protein
VSRNAGSRYKTLVLVRRSAISYIAVSSRGGEDGIGTGLPSAPVPTFLAVDRARLRRGVFGSIRQLEALIKTYIEAPNADPRPFRWTKTADGTLPASSTSGFADRCDRIE